MTAVFDYWLSGCLLFTDSELSGSHSPDASTTKSSVVCGYFHLKKYVFIGIK